MYLSNEVIVFLFTLFYMLSALLVYKMGKVWLQTFLVISYIITLCITAKFFDFFGFPTSAGVVTYAGLFLATDMLTERYGKDAGFQTVRIGFVMSLIFIAMTQANLLFQPLPYVKNVSDSMDIVFGSSARIMIAGFTVYLIAQHLDVWLYHKIHELTQEKWLWLRNNGSTFLSQALDSILFFTFAFYGTMPDDKFFEVLLVGMIMKWIIALFDTPFMYLAKRITPLDLITPPAENSSA